MSISQGSTQSATEVRSFFGKIADRYDLTNHLLSAGCDFLWRRRAARIVAKWMPQRVLDLATGSGDLALEIQKSCPESQIVGADFSEAMLERARAKGLRELVVADALHLPFEDGSFDVVTVAFGLRNMESWPRAVAEMRRVLRPGGHVLIMDFSMPPAPLLWLYRPYLRHILPGFASLVTRQRAIYEYFADSIERFPSGDAMSRMLAENGLTCEQQVPLQGGIVTIYAAAKGA